MRTLTPFRSTVALGLLAALLAFRAPLGATEPAPDSRPDIVVFITDDHSHFDTELYGSADLRTPNMLRVSEAGMTFDRAFVASPTCAPSRAALLTGLMPARNGAEPNHSRPDADIRKWPAYFQELGYEVVAFGKVSHYGHTADYGFDHFAHDTFHDHRGIAAAVEFLRERDSETSRPLCIMVGSNWPHVPWPENPEAFRPDEMNLPPGSIDTPETRHWRTRFAAAVTRADKDLGRILDAVETYMKDDTLFLLSADHGTQWPFGKWNLYDAGIQVPLAVAWPGKIEAGSRTDAMVGWIDFLPTLLEAAGGEAPESIDGRSFLPVLLGENDDHREKIFTTHSGDGRWNIYPMRSVRTDDWKYIRNLYPEFAFTTHIDLHKPPAMRAFFATWEKAAETDPEAAAILERYHARPSEELYDLRNDPFEQHNLADNPDHAQRLETMRGWVDDWMEAQDDEGTVYAEPRLLSDPDSYGPGGARD